MTGTPLTGQELQVVIPDLARLRMGIFRDFPYLYEGNQQYEEQYLSTYAQAPGMFVAVARDAGRVVGVSTALPLAHETAEVQRPFLNHPEFNVQDILYLGESLLLPHYRGRGLGHQFFDLRERHARTLGLNVTTFCAVQRPENHPARPASYRPLHAFWRSRGYTERPDLTTEMHWQDVGQSVETPHEMRFWVK